MNADTPGRIRLTLEGDPAKLLELLKSAVAHLEKRPSRLSPEVAADIRQRFAKGESVRSLAKAHAVTTHSIYNILKGKTWPERSAQIGDEQEK